MVRLFGLGDGERGGILAWFETLVTAVLTRIADLTARILDAQTASVDDLNTIRPHWAQAVDAELLPRLAEVFARGATGITDELTAVGVATSDLASPDAAAFMAAARNRLVGVGDLLWEAARDELVAGVRAGDDMQQLAVRVAGAAGVTEARARVIARTEVISVLNLASITQVRMLADPTVRKEWIATQDLSGLAGTCDERTRPTHCKADGQRVLIGERFEVGAAQLDFPGDPSGPPDETIQCRCSMAFDLDDEPSTMVATDFHLPGKHNQKDHAGGGRSKTLNAVDGFTHALSGQAALDAAPAKLRRAPAGHCGDYTGEALDGPPGMGSVRALSEYEGVEYQPTNTFLRGLYVDPNTGKPADGTEGFLRGVPERINELDQTMRVSRLTADVRVSRIIRHGAEVFGKKAWYGDIVDFETDDLDEFDRQIDEHWNKGERPNLTGLRWRELGYSSTTADPTVAAEFGGRWRQSNSPMDGEPVIMTILAPQGVGGVQLAEMGHAAEILLERDLTMEIVADHGVDADGFRRVDVVASTS